MRHVNGSTRNRSNGQQSRAAAPVAHIVEAPTVEVPRVSRQKSRLHGWGIFARERITKNRRIIAYTGEKISAAESLKRERRYIRTGNIWCFRLNRRWVIDAAVGGNNARFINHSCKPNCYTQIVDGIIWVRAGRTIEPGEELTYNYFTDGEGAIECRCRPGCKSVL
jgi:SET domain-containing protein